MMERYHGWAWAIDTCSKEGHGLIGVLGLRLNFRQLSDLPPWQDGCRIALWRTRKEATASLPCVRKAFPRAKVLRVAVTISARE